MPFLQLGSVVIPSSVAGAVRRASERVGTTQRMFNGALRSSVRRVKRQWGVTTKLLTATEADVLHALDGKIVVGSGDLIGATTRSELDLFHYEHGVDSLSELGAVFTRAGESTYVDENGVIKTAPSGQIVGDHYIAGEPHLLLGPALENRALRSNEADNAAWTKSRATVTANADTAPDGTTTADRLVEDTTASASHRIYSNAAVTISSNAAIAVGRCVKAGTRSWILLGAMDGTETNFARVYFNLANGTKGGNNTGGTGIVLSSDITPLGNGWYFCRVLCRLDSSLTQGYHYTGLATGDGGASYNGNGTGYVSMWGAHMGVDVDAYTIVPTQAAAVTRVADVLYFPIAFEPQALTMYLKSREIGAYANIGATKYPAHLGAANTLTDPRFGMAFSGAATFSSLYDNGVTQVTSSQTVGAARHDVVEHLATLSSAWVTQVSRSLNSDAVQSGTASGASGPATLWAAARLYLASVGPIALRRLVIARGVKTMDEMRGAKPVRCEVSIGDASFAAVGAGSRRALNISLREV